jgi:hypothetical protein
MKLQNSKVHGPFGPKKPQKMQVNFFPRFIGFLNERLGGVHA